MSRTEKACAAIRTAKNEQQVLGAVRAYLDSLDASAAKDLPGELLVLGLAPAEEMIQSALQALHTCMEVAGGTRGEGIVSETILVFTTAARRLAALAKDAA